MDDEAVHPGFSSGVAEEGSPPRYLTAPVSLAFPVTGKLRRSFHVEARRGSGSSAGVSPGEAWRSLEPLRRARLGLGDVVNLAVGSVLEGPLVIEASGQPGRQRG